MSTADDLRRAWYRKRAVIVGRCAALDAMDTLREVLGHPSDYEPDAADRVIDRVYQQSMEAFHFARLSLATRNGSPSENELRCVDAESPAVRYTPTRSSETGVPAVVSRPCAAPGCPYLVGAQPCPIHGQTRAYDRVYEQQRGSAWRRGYGRSWRLFRRHVRARMIHLGIVPVCGASLPGGPLMQDSQCKAAGLLTDEALHLDHDPPLATHERQDVRAVCNPLRVGWLCPACHARKTQHEQQQQGTR